jgi:predicted LPLAT superfamily acyltransferase
MARMPEDLPTAAGPTQGGGEWSNVPERSNLVALRFVSWLAVSFGRRVARLVLHPVTLYFFLFSPSQRRHVKRYLVRAIGPHMGWRDGYRLIYNFAATALDRVYFLRGRMDLFDLQVVGAEAIEDEAREGRGAFLVGAHFGSFEAVGASRPPGSKQGRLKLAMLMYTQNAQQISAALAAISEPGLMPEVIALGRPGSMLALRDWMDAGGLAGMLADRTLPRQDAQQRETSLAIDFLGTPAVFYDGPFRLAALLRRKLFFMAGIYHGGARYEVRFEPLWDFRAGAANGAERERQIRAAVEAYVARLEGLCRAHPHNWFNFHDFWLEDTP